MGGEEKQSVGLRDNFFLCTDEELRRISGACQQGRVMPGPPPLCFTCTAAPQRLYLRRGSLQDLNVKHARHESLKHNTLH